MDEQHGNKGILACKQAGQSCEMSVSNARLYGAEAAAAATPQAKSLSISMPLPDLLVT